MESFGRTLFLSRFGGRFRTSPKKRSWANVKGLAVVDVEDLGIGARRLLAPFGCPDGQQYDQLEIEFRSSGYDDPGRTMGLPENCYPPEHGDEREVERVVLHPYVLPQAVVDLLERDPVFVKAVEDMELPDAPDWEDRADW